jgi:hypothetical protein
VAQLSKVPFDLFENAIEEAKNNINLLSAEIKQARVDFN